MIILSIALLVICLILGLSELIPYEDILKDKTSDKN